MSAPAQTLLGHLATVRAERAKRRLGEGLADAVRRVKHYQQRRFSHSYADLLASTRYRPAAQFFLDELYGPRDFTRRDAQFERVVPALVRLFPAAIVATVATLAELHGLSEQLDSAMAEQLAAGAAASPPEIDAVAGRPEIGAVAPPPEIDAAAYARAWQASATPAQRERQIALTLEVGASLDRLTANVLVRNSLRLMRGPAWAAGLGELQTFLEAGFETFRAMHGAQEFLGFVDAREHRLCAALFGADPHRLTPAVRDLLPPPP